MQVGYQYKLTRQNQGARPRQATYCNKVGYQHKLTMQKQATHCKMANYERKLHTLTMLGTKTSYIQYQGRVLAQAIYCNKALGTKISCKLEVP